MILAAVANLSNVFKLPTWVLWLLVVLLLAANGASLRDWNLFHYQLGTKYFSELGYTDLYECYLRATNEDITRRGREIPDRRWRRDLETYAFIPGDFVPTCPVSSFSEARWENFVSDLDQFRVPDHILLDKGLNATPIWIALASLVAAAPSQLVALADPVALLLAFAICVFLAGWRRAAYAALLVVGCYAVTDRLWGNFAQYQWLALTLVGVAAYHRDRSLHIVGGALLGFAAGLRIFPAVLLIGKSRRAWLGAMWGGAAAVAVGLFNPLGIEGYMQFIQNMALHSDFIDMEPLNVGLQNLIIMSSSFPAALQYHQIVSGVVDPVTVTFDNPVLPWLVLLPLVLASPYGIMFGLLTVSRYYMVILAVVALERGEEAARVLLIIYGLILAWASFDPLRAFILSQWLLVAYFALYWLRWRLPGEWYLQLIKGVKRVLDYRA